MPHSCPPRPRGRGEPARAPGASGCGGRDRRGHPCRRALDRLVDAASVRARRCDAADARPLPGALRQPRADRPGHAHPDDRRAGRGRGRHRWPREPGAGLARDPGGHGGAALSLDGGDVPLRARGAGHRGGGAGCGRGCRGRRPRADHRRAGDAGQRGGGDHRAHARRAGAPRPRGDRPADRPAEPRRARVARARARAAGPPDRRLGLPGAVRPRPLQDGERHPRPRARRRRAQGGRLRHPQVAALVRARLPHRGRGAAGAAARRRRSPKDSRSANGCVRRWRPRDQAAST